MTGDATDIGTLSEARIETATAVIAVTNNDNINILVAQIAKELYNVQHVVSRLYDPDRGCAYREFGINTICPADLSRKEIENILRISDLRVAL
jgi:trk system potassium uptake protein TrkA